MTAESVPPGFSELYGALSPDGPDHFPVVFNKLHDIWVKETGLEVADLAHATAPTLILAGRRDLFTPEDFPVDGPGRHEAEDLYVIGPFPPPTSGKRSALPPGSAPIRACSTTPP